MAVNEYKVEVTPLIRFGTYASSATDISEFVQVDLGDISQKADSADFDIGIYTYGYVDLKAINYNGWFSDVNIGATIFKFGRDKAKVTISYKDLEGNYNLVFKGIINDEFTTQDLDKSTVKFRIMSYDSIFRKLACTVGTIASGQTVKAAFKNLFNRPAVTSLLNYDVDNIDPLLGDIIIDDASELVNISFKESLDKLLAISCSVMFIDEDDYIVIRSRDADPTLSYEFWNAADYLGRNNIIRISDYNTGLQRAFNLFVIGNVSSLNEASIADFGLRKKEIENIDSIITDTEKQQLICDTYRDSFSIPKRELRLTVKTEEAKGLRLFNLVTLGYSQKVVKRPNAPYLYVGGVPEDTEDNLPYVIESQQVEEDAGFKIIEKTIKPDKLYTELKLREIGTLTGDSVLDFLVINGEPAYIRNSRILL